MPGLYIIHYVGIFSVKDVIQILQSGEKQLRVLEIYLDCLTPDFIEDSDYFIDKNKHLTVSESLLMGCDRVLEQTGLLDQAIDVLQVRL